MKKMMQIALAAALFSFAARAETDAKTVRTWKAKCASCHGATGAGDTEQGKKMKIADFTSADWQKSATDAQIKGAIENGVKKDGKEMDGYKEKLDAAQIDGLVQYIRSFKK